MLFAPPATQRSRLDAIVVPSSRSAGSLDAAIALAAAVNVLLVVLASKAARVDHIAEVVARVPGAKALVVEVPQGYGSDLLRFDTSAPHFHAASAGRQSDLSTKRNLGLLLARLLGWGKILFLDDDVHGVGPGHITRLARHLDRHATAGMVSRQFPDNSVVCHANRLSGAVQDVFISGAALGVNCEHGVPPFFPDIYNEDWFFFLPYLLSQGRLAKVGSVWQRAYDPYGNPARAAWEEFGDTLAEGVFALIEAGDDDSAATPRYWREFHAARDDFLDRVAERLDKRDERTAYHALASVETARKQLAEISPDLCVDFLASWRKDNDSWRSRIAALPPLRSLVDVMDHLGLGVYRRAEFGNPECRIWSAPQFDRARSSGRVRQGR